MLAVTGLFFGIIITVNLVLAWFAYGNWTGLVVKNSYVASQQFNAKLAEYEKQRALGWKSRLSVAGNRLEFFVRDKAARPVTGLNVSALVGHPVAATGDRFVSLKETAPGVYSTRIKLSQGQWMADVTARTKNTMTYRQIFRFVTAGGKG